MTENKLYPYQMSGVAFFEAKNGRALLADEPGLGKTRQVIAWLDQRPDLRPVVIVVPAALKEAWAREFGKYTGTRANVRILSGRSTNNGNETNHANPQQPGLRVDYYIVNYDILPDSVSTRDGIRRTIPGRIHELMGLQPAVLVVDESHYIKNRKRARSKAVLSLGRSPSVKSVIALSGTPITSKPEEFLTTINLVKPGLFKNNFYYLKRYCDAKKTRFGWDFSGASNTAELHNILTSTIMLRRKKSEVLSDLPQKTRVVVPIQISNRNKYNSANKDILSWIRKQCGDEAAEKAKKAQALVKIEKLKQLVLEGKMRHIISWVEDFLNSGEKLVLLGTHKSFVREISGKFKDISVIISGDTPPEEKQTAIDRFQGDPECKFLVGNLQAAGVGITLTAATNLAFAQLGWTPAELDQAEDRIHRIGQKGAATIWYLLGQNTIEEKIASLLDKKRQTVGKILDGEAVASEDSIISQLIEQMGKE
jgi:SWI/SNF-related matrix-associated actin-dependent regulator 1 of chromatin subfamily A